MSQTNRSLSAVEVAALELGAPATSEHDRRRSLVRFDEGLLRDSLDAEDYAIIAQSNRSIERAHGRPSLRAFVAGAALSALALASPLGEPVRDRLTGSQDVIEAVEPGAQDAGIYHPEEGETATGIAVKIDAAIDGIPNNQNIEELRNDIQEQAGPDGIHSDDNIAVPLAADTDPNTPDVQL